MNAPPSTWLDKFFEALTVRWNGAPVAPRSAVNFVGGTVTDDPTNDATVVALGGSVGPAGGDLGGTYPNPSVARVGGVAVSGAPTAGQVLTATAPAAAHWANPTGGGGTPFTVAPPSAVGAWTVVGAGTIAQVGPGLSFDSVVAASGSHVLTPIPGGVVPGGPWKLTIIGAAEPTLSFTYPGFGVVVSNGVTPGVSTALFCGWYQYGSNVLCLGSWSETMNNAARPQIYSYTNNSNGDLPEYSVFIFRIICDGTYLYYQTSRDAGASWVTYCANTVGTVQATIAAPMTHYGFSFGPPGSDGGTGVVAGFVDGLEMVSIPAPATVANIVFVNNTLFVTTNTAHGLATGGSVAINGVVSSGSMVPNGVYLSGPTPTGGLGGPIPIVRAALRVTSATTFALLLPPPPGGGVGTFGYTSGGTVTNLS